MSSHLPSIIPVAPSETADEGRVFLGRRYRNDPYKAKVFDAPQDAIIPTTTTTHSSQQPIHFPLHPSHLLSSAGVSNGSHQLLSLFDSSNSSMSLMPSVQVGVRPSTLAKPPAPPVGGLRSSFPRTLSPLPATSSASQEEIEFDMGTDGERPFTGIADIRFKLFQGQHAVPKYLFDVLRAGDMVVVQGDRGEDIGIVEQCSPVPADKPLPPVPVLRLANATDRHRYNGARARELEVLPRVIECVSEVGLDGEIRIRDIEFQTDLQKLTIVFDPLTRKKKRVDFRELQRAVFKLVKCRIWLLNSIELHGR